MQALYASKWLYTDKHQQVWGFILKDLIPEQIDAGLKLIMDGKKYADYPPTPMAFKNLCRGILCDADKISRPALPDYTSNGFKLQNKAHGDIISDHRVRILPPDEIKRLQELYCVFGRIYDDEGKLLELP